MAQTLTVVVAVTLVLQTVPVTHFDAVLVAKLMMIVMVMTNPRKSARGSKNTPCEEGKEVLELQRLLEMMEIQNACRFIYSKCITSPNIFLLDMNFFYEFTGRIHFLHIFPTLAKFLKDWKSITMSSINYLIASFCNIKL